MNYFYEKDLLIHNADSRIKALLDLKDGQLTENQLKDVLKEFNLKDLLCLFSYESKRIFNNKGNSGNSFMRRIEATGTFVTQTALLYMANIAIISGATDYNWSFLNLEKEANICILSNIYNNKLKTKLPKQSNNSLMNILIPAYYQQIKYQLHMKNLIARSYILFGEIAKNYSVEEDKNINETFLDFVGIDLSEFILICYFILGYSLSNPNQYHLNEDYLVHYENSELAEIFQKDKLEKVFNLLSINYQNFKEEDYKINQGIEEDLTKSRFNLLTRYPIIELDDKRNGKYIIPSMTAFADRVFANMYWIFHNIFEEKNLVETFRGVFGKEIFEKYIGDLLKEIYPDKELIGEIMYKKSGSIALFTDWVVLSDEKAYLFEVKSQQYNLKAQQTGDIDNEIKKKVVTAIIKLYKKMGDIDCSEELACLREKELVSIIIYFDLPMIEHFNLHRSLIIEELKVYVSEGKVDEGVLDFRFYLMNVENLEYYLYVSQEIELEELHEELLSKTNESLLSLIKNYYIEKEEHSKSKLNTVFDQIINKPFLMLENYNKTKNVQAKDI